MSDPLQETGLSALPDDLLVSIFGKVDFIKRHSTLPLVCRRWRELACAPPLLRSIEVCSSAGTAATLSSLLAWLRHRAAGRVQQLALRVQVPLGSELSSRSASAELAAELAATLAACSAGCHLADLRLHLRGLLAHSTGTPLRLGPACCCCGGGSGLTRLEVCIRGGPLEISADALLRCTALRALSLEAEPLAAVPLHRPGLLPQGSLIASPQGVNQEQRAGLDSLYLPRSLTQLSLCGGSRSSGLPRVAGLGQLRHLSLGDVSCCPDGYAPLTALPSLHSLSLSRCLCLPVALLARLPSLAALRLDDTACLQLLTEPKTVIQPLASQLTHLVLRLDEMWASVPPCLGLLTSLQRLAWDGPPPSCPQLPGGPWLTGLRQVLLPADMAAASLAGLTAGAAQLEVLALHPFCPGSWGAYRSLLRWAQHQPCLRRLCLGLGSGPGQGPSSLTSLPKVELAAALLDDTLEAQRARPELVIERASGPYAELAEVLAPAG